MKSRFFKFTLVELLVSMAVFSIMLVMMMQLFVGVRQIWQGSNEKNQIYANTRVAMDMLTSMLQTIYFSPDINGNFYFKLDSVDNPVGSKIYFATKTKYALPGVNSIRFVAFQVPNNFDNKYNAIPSNLKNKLVITVLSDAPFKFDSKNNGETEFCLWFPEYIDADGNPISQFSTKANSLYSCLDDKLKGDSVRDYLGKSVLVKNVVEFKIKAFKSNGDEWNNSANPNVQNSLPAYFEIKIGILSDSKYEIWKNLVGIDDSESDNAKIFRKKYQYDFFRKVHIGNYWE